MKEKELLERLCIAEYALVSHGYKKSCDIPACNCGDQWGHGGNASARLDEIDDITRDYYRNGELLRTRIERIVELASKSEWQPIETAPKDQPIAVWCRRLGLVSPAKWNSDGYVKNPQPFWDHWGSFVWGGKIIRNYQPTHWMPLHAPPEEE